MSEPTRVVGYDPAWPTIYAAWAEAIRRAMGPVELRLDHIGSTAVPGLKAKPIIDSSPPGPWARLSRPC